MVVMRGVNGAFGVYYLALLEEFSWSRSDGASIASVNFVVYAVACAGGRLGLRSVRAAVADAAWARSWSALGLVLSSFATSLLRVSTFPTASSRLSAKGALSFVGHNALISFWFVRQRATAIGIASMGQGLGALVMVPATQMLIDSIGWRWTYIVTGSLLLLLLVPANAFFQRRAPQDVGQFPDGDDAPATRASISAPLGEAARPARLDARRSGCAPFHSGASPLAI